MNGVIINELSEVLTCNVGVSYSGLSNRVERAYAFIHSINSYLGDPALSSKSYTTESRFVGYSKSLISHVLRLCTRTNVGFSIIQCVVILMICLEFVIRNTKNIPMHHDYPESPIFSNPSNCVGVIDSGLPQHTPVPLRQSFKVFSIYDGVLSLCKRDQAVGWIERLGDFVSKHTDLWHKSTSNGFVYQLHSNI